MVGAVTGDDVKVFRLIDDIKVIAQHFDMSVVGITPELPKRVGRYRREPSQLTYPPNQCPLGRFCHQTYGKRQLGHLFSRRISQFLVVVTQ
jgi:hypothetical protein